MHKSEKMGNKKNRAGATGLLQFTILRAGLPHLLRAAARKGTNQPTEIKRRNNKAEVGPEKQSQDFISGPTEGRQTDNQIRVP